IGQLEKIYEAINNLNRRNYELKAKFKNDEKFARLHKRILEKKLVKTRETTIFETLMDIKKQTDEQVLNMTHIVDNPEFFSAFMSPIVIDNFENHGIRLDLDSARQINTQTTAEYLYQFNQ
ncbi:MAG: type I restriction endonuclease subunit R, partial [Candidatus Moraniibacteriota bacterium]